MQLIIDQPGLQHPGQRVLWAFVTTAFWVLWLYLWLPLITFVGWLFGLYRGYYFMAVLGGYHEILRLLVYFLIVVAILGGALVLWALVQRVRFRGMDRRQQRPPAALDALAAFHGIAVEDLRLWQRAQRAVAHHDTQGRLSFIWMLQPGEPGPRPPRTARDRGPAGILVERPV
jgi:biofilm PGA synthesis protein PgaD